MSLEVFSASAASATEEAPKCCLCLDTEGDDQQRQPASEREIFVLSACQHSFHRLCVRRLLRHEFAKRIQVSSSVESSSSNALPCRHLNCPLCRCKVSVWDIRRLRVQRRLLSVKYNVEEEDPTAEYAVYVREGSPTGEVLNHATAVARNMPGCCFSLCRRSRRRQRHCHSLSAEGGTEVSSNSGGSGEDFTTVCKSRTFLADFELETPRPSSMYTIQFQRESPEYRKIVEESGILAKDLPSLETDAMEEKEFEALLETQAEIPIDVVIHLASSPPPPPPSLPPERQSNRDRSPILQQQQQQQQQTTTTTTTTLRVSPYFQEVPVTVTTPQPPTPLQPHSPLSPPPPPPSPSPPPPTLHPIDATYSERPRAGPSRIKPNSRYWMCTSDGGEVHRKKNTGIRRWAEKNIKSLSEREKIEMKRELLSRKSDRLFQKFRTFLSNAETNLTELSKITTELKNTENELKQLKLSENKDRPLLVFLKSITSNINTARRKISFLKHIFIPEEEEDDDDDDDERIQMEDQEEE